MMRSLRFKWSLTLFATSLAGILLVGVIATSVNYREFRRHRDRELRSLYGRLVGEFYKRNKAWDKIDIIRTGIYVDKPLMEADSIDAETALHSSIVETLHGASFVVADEDGLVVQPAGDYRAGDKLRPGETARGLPIVLDGKKVATVVGVASPGFAPAELDFLGRVNRFLVVAAGSAVFLAVLVGTLISRAFLQPLTELTGAIRKMKVGEFDQRVPVRANDELGELGSAFNQLAEELQRVYKLRKQMTADIAHELRTPLTVISGYLEGLREGVIPATGENFEVIYQEAQLLNRLVEDLRLLSLADAGELNLVYQPVRPRELLAGVAKSFSPMAESHSVDLTVAVHQDTKVAELDRDRMTQVLRNLVSNALRYTVENGQIELSAEPDGDQLLLAVSDNGSGIPQNELENIFERFYRVDSARYPTDKASGLGLAIAASIVEAHGGRISATSRPGSGTKVMIWLPLKADMETN